VESPVMKVQARMEALGSNASVFTAFAFQQEETTNIQVSLGRQGGNLEIRLDDEVLERVVVQEVTIPGDGYTLTISASQVVAVFSSGFTFSISLADPSGGSLNFQSSADARLQSNLPLSGLLGDFDGNPDNDLRDPSTGSLLPPSTATLEEIHTQFGSKWRTVAAESIFTYAPGTSHAGYQDEGFTPNFSAPSLDSIPSEIVAMCGGSLACLYDFVNTGSGSFANATRGFEQRLNETREVMETEVKMCPSPDKPRNGGFVANNYLLGSTVRFHCEEGYDLAGVTSAECVLEGDGEAAVWDQAAPTCSKTDSSSRGWKLGSSWSIILSGAAMLPLFIWRLSTWVR